MIKKHLVLFFLAFSLLITAVILILPVKPVAAITQLECVKTAAATRETAIQAAYTTFYSSVNAARATRKTAVINAWLIADGIQRENALKAAWFSFKVARTTASSTLLQEREAAWVQFRAARTACGCVNTYCR